MCFGQLLIIIVHYTNQPIPARFNDLMLEILNYLIKDTESLKVRALGQTGDYGDINSNSGWNYQGGFYQVSILLGCLLHPMSQLCHEKL